MKPCFCKCHYCSTVHAHATCLPTNRSWSTSNGLVSRGQACAWVKQRAGQYKMCVSLVLGFVIFQCPPTLQSPLGARACVPGNVKNQFPRLRGAPLGFSYG
ncbi:unnamed protein product [Ixodes pacificus]